MDTTHAASLLHVERLRIKELLVDAHDAGQDERAGAHEAGDMSDPATSLTAEGEGDAVTLGLQRRLATIERAEQRLRDGSYGRSTLSGVPLSDERLEADPAAELTVEEAQQL